MTAITARFDGEKFVLPADIRLDGVGEVVITLSDDVRIASADSPPRRTLREVIDAARPSGRTMEDVEQQLRELDAEWDGSDKRTAGEPR